MLERRAALLSAARSFFAARDVLEVETPVLCSCTTTDPHIGSLRLQGKNGLWLRTSPEHHMKRLLAAGAPDIYQIAKVFRADEAGPRHQPEFTLIEWYRHNFSLADMIRDCCEFIMQLSAHTPQPGIGYRCISYRDAFAASCDLDPFNASLEALQNRARRLQGWHDGLLQSLGADRQSWLDLLAGELVYPRLGANRLEVVTGYPAEQAMLAQLDPDDPRQAERFEVFLNGMELANGYHELRDAAEQSRRFAADAARRCTLGIETVSADPALLAALHSGLPDCSGVAVGLDRIMLATDSQLTMDSVLSFPPGC